jgi:hypothetical protein
MQPNNNKEKILITNVKEATSEEMNEWLENDYFMAMKFDPLVLFVVIPAIIQVVVLALCWYPCTLMDYFLVRILKLFFGLGKTDPYFRPSPIKLLFIGIFFGLFFLSIVTILIVITGVIL